jgi:hypothetical protein
MSSQIVMTSISKRPKIALPYVFTEHGVTMLASVLKSPKARNIIAIVRAFVALRKLVLHNKEVLEQLNELKARLGEHDVQLNQIYDAIENLLEEKVDQKKWEERERIGFKNKLPTFILSFHSNVSIWPIVMPTGMEKILSVSLRIRF